MATSSPLSALGFLEATLDEHGLERGLERISGTDEYSLTALAAGLLRRAAHSQREQPVEAERMAAAAREMVAQQDLRLAARAARLHGSILTHLGRHPDALVALDSAEARFRLLGLDADAAHSLILKTHALSSLGRTEAALEACRAAMALFEAEGDVDGIARVKLCLCPIYNRLGRHRDAVRTAREALALGASIDVGSLVALDCNMALALGALNRHAAARRYLTRARSTVERASGRVHLAHIEHNRGYHAFQRRRFDEALALYQHAEDAYREIGHDRAWTELELDRAELFLQLGQPEEALRRARRAAELAQSASAREVGRARQFAGFALLLLGRLDEAEDEFLEARACFSGDDEGVWRAHVDLMRAMLAKRRSRFQLARDLARRAQEVMLGAGRVVQAGSADVVLAQIEVEAGLAPQALERLTQARARLRRMPAPWLEFELDRWSGLTHLALGNPRRGIELLRRAIETLEHMRSGVPADEFMVHFLASRAAVYRETVDALAQTQRVEEAFDLGERARSRALLDMLAERSRSGRPMAAHRLTDLRVRSIREQLSALYAELHRAWTRLEPGEERGHRVAQLQESIRGRELSLSRALRRAKAASPSLAQREEPLRLADAQALLDADTTLLEYFVTDTAVTVFVVTREGVEFRRLAVNLSELQRRCGRFRFHLAKFNLGPEYVGRSASLIQRSTRENLTALHRMLVRPVERLLRTRRVVVVPHGPLHDVPFHALATEDGWLADGHDLTYVPSASVLRWCRRAKARSEGAATVLALPDGAAPAIAQEADCLERLFGSEATVLRDGEATSAAFADALRSSSMVHVASHAGFHRERPMLSSIRFADDWMNLYDVYDLDVRAELVVLSACETGGGHVTAGDDLLGLVRAFLYAGATQLLVSRWRVDDESAAELMRTFHTERHAGASSETALARATAAVRAQRPHPYHWAPFTLVGTPSGVEEDVRRTPGGSSPPAC